MLLKQATVFVLKQEIPSADVLEQALSESRIPEQMGGLEWSAQGFAPATPFSDALVSEQNGSLLLCLRRMDKVLPGAVIKEELDKRIKKIQAEEGRNVCRKEKQELKEEITDSLLPRAMVKSASSYALFAGKYLFVEGSQKKAEEFVTAIRTALDGLEVALPVTRHSPSQSLSDALLSGSLGDNFQFQFKVSLIGQGDVPPKAKFVNCDITDSKVLDQIREGRMVEEIELYWKEHLSFTLTRDFGLKGIRYMDILVQDADATAADGDAEGAYAAQQIICADCLSELVDELSDIFGGFEG